MPPAIVLKIDGKEKTICEWINNEFTDYRIEETTFNNEEFLSIIGEKSWINAQIHFITRIGIMYNVLCIKNKKGLVSWKTKKIW